MPTSVPSAAHSPEPDPTLANVTADLAAYLILERALCTCEPDAGLDLCGWDDP